MPKVLLTLLVLLLAAPAAFARSNPTPGAGLPRLGPPAAGVELVGDAGPAKLPSSNQAVFAPGTKVTLAVARRSPVTLVVHRITAKGRAMKVVKRARLRQGRVVVPLAGTPGARYRFRIGSGGFYATTTPPPDVVDVVAPSPPAAPPAGAPVPPPFPAPTGPPAVEASLDRTAVAPGDTVQLTLRNSGGTTLTHGVCRAGFQHATPAGWANVPEPEPAVCPAVAILLRPGESWSTPVRVPGELSPGRYRVTWTLSAGDGSYPTRQQLMAAAELDVV